jgi:hypothetical protein
LLKSFLRSRPLGGKEPSFIQHFPKGNVEYPSEMGEEAKLGGPSPKLGPPKGGPRLGLPIAKAIGEAKLPFPFLAFAKKQRPSFGGEGAWGPLAPSWGLQRGAPDQAKVG